MKRIDGDDSWYLALNTVNRFPCKNATVLILNARRGRIEYAIDLQIAFFEIYDRESRMKRIVRRIYKG